MSIPPPEIIRVRERIVACDGGEGPLGHPRVFLDLGDEGCAECPYCDRLFILVGGPADHGEAASGTDHRCGATGEAA